MIGSTVSELTSVITGGAGFIGSHLTESLLSQGHRVIVVDDLSTGRKNNIEGLLDNPNVEYIEGSVTEESLVNEVVDRADRVYHLAAAVGVALIAKQPIQTIERNVYPTQLILNRLGERASNGKFVPCFIASTSEVYGKNPKEVWSEEDDLVFGATTKPRWSYGVSKAIDEFLGLAFYKEKQLPVVVGRFFNVVGPRQTGAYGMVLPRFVEAALRGGFMTMAIKCDVLPTWTMSSEPFRIWSTSRIPLAASITSAAMSPSRFCSWPNELSSESIRKQRSSSKPTPTPMMIRSRTSVAAFPI